MSSELCPPQYCSGTVSVNIPELGLLEGNTVRVILYYFITGTRYVLVSVNNTPIHPHEITEQQRFKMHLNFNTEEKEVDSAASPFMLRF